MCVGYGWSLFIEWNGEAGEVFKVSGIWWRIEEEVELCCSIIFLRKWKKVGRDGGCKV